MSDKVYIIGNGESRRHYDLERMKGKAILYGCNAIYRDFDPDYICAIDRGMIKELRANYNLEKIITLEHAKPERTSGRPEPRRLRSHVAMCNNEILYELNESQQYRNTGMFATLIACMTHKPKEVYLVGFDWYYEPSGVYRGTENYAKDGSTKNRIEEWKELMATFPDTKFTIVKMVGLHNTIFETNGFNTIRYDSFRGLR